MDILSVDLNNVYYDLLTIIHVRLLAWHNKLKQCKTFKKELMPVAWHPTRLRDWCMPEYEKKEINQVFIDKK